MKYNNEKYCRLANGEVQPLYIKGNPRNFYERDGKWWLDFSVSYMGSILEQTHDEIVEFLSEVVINGKVFR